MTAVQGVELIFALQVIAAAVRETAAAGEPVESLFSNQQGPFLVTDIAHSGNDELVLSMWFADRENVPLEERSIETFNRTMTELESTILRGSQHTFWGTLHINQSCTTTILECCVSSLFYALFALPLFHMTIARSSFATDCLPQSKHKIRINLVPSRSLRVRRTLRSALLHATRS